MTALPEPFEAAGGEGASALEVSDATLLERVRGGDKQAFGALWGRHHRAGLNAARAITSAFEADDLVSEAFVRVLKAIERGNGPTAAFRPYLVTTIRSVAARWGAQPAELTPEDFDTVDPDSRDEAIADRFDQNLTVRAFNTLPQRWQEVLWYTEAEQLPPREVAALIGISPNAVSALAKRAKEGLRHAWVHAHIETVPAGSECRWSIDRLAASTRKPLPAREQQRLDAHLDECDRCPLAAAEITEASRRLGVLILIGFLGASAATAYSALLKPAAASAATLGASAVWPPKPTHLRNVAIGTGSAIAAGAIAVGVAFAVTGGSAPPREQLVAPVAHSSAAPKASTPDASPSRPDAAPSSSEPAPSPAAPAPNTAAPAGASPASKAAPAAASAPRVSVPPAPDSTSPGTSAPAPSPVPSPTPTPTQGPAPALPLITFTGCATSEDGSTLTLTWVYDGAPVPGQTPSFAVASNGIAIGGGGTSTAGPVGGVYTTEVRASSILGLGSYTVAANSTAGGATAGATNSVSAPAISVIGVTAWGPCSVTSD